ncbi:MAG: hypothetical protein M3R62_02395 [Acidobacteriota bacterium]|nr:hypothetical protein [Acidobacteriota bacterium]
MITVYVWIPQTSTSLGHASMKISPRKPEFAGTVTFKDGSQVVNTTVDISEFYVSWWPKSQPPSFGGIARTFLMEGEAHTFQEDINNANEARMPEFETRIYTLDEDAISKYWYNFRYKPSSHWHAITNCATLVGRCLRKAGGPLFLGDNVIWTPMQVKTYATQIAGSETVCQ